MKNRWIFLCFWMVVIASCNKDEDITTFNPQPPKIALDSENSIYKAKVGREVTIAPVYENIAGAIYTWKIDGQITSTDSVFRYTFEENGEYFVTIEATTRYGSKSEEAKVEVSDLAPPVISLVVPPAGLDVVAGKQYLLEPDVQNADSTTLFSWKINGVEVGNEKDLTFCAQELGEYEVSFYAENGDGNDTKIFQVNALERIPVKIVFPAPMYGLYDEEVIKYVSLGRTIYLRPYLFDEVEPRFQWKLDGIGLPGATSQIFAFKPEATGEYSLSLTVTDKDESVNESSAKITSNITRKKEYETTIGIKVVCCEREGYYQRTSSGSNSAGIQEVLEFVAAPGQFVNEHYQVSSLAEAKAFARESLNKGTYVSLGGFGGYIIVSFDHSIDNVEGQYNFSVLGNQFEGSSEPGVVWVSQDVNGNGLPDDEWYELKGSEYGLSCTKQFYAVTYYRPEGTGMNVPWKDNYGKTGSVDYLKQFHSQSYYYPNWIKENSYTLFGSCLEARNYQDDGKAEENGSSEYWVNPSYEWGYVDNYGSDMIAGTSWVGFKISNAVNPDGSSANLKYVDFVKVVNGLNTKSGWLGEVSTEVVGFNDENINKTGK